MLNRIAASLALIATLGLAACGEDEVEGDAEVTREVITEQDTRTVEVEVPTIDTAVVERRVDIDTAVSVDTIENPDAQLRNQENSEMQQRNR